MYIFERFKDSNGKYMTSLADDIQGMLSLYEASHLAFDGETILDEAREFTRFHLNKIMFAQKMDKKSIDINNRVRHALEIPYHHRMQRLEARWNIEMYDHDHKPKMLHAFAILDFNMVQSVYQRDLQEVSRWWSDMGLANKLSFARDRLMESFFWAVGMVYEPKYNKCRVGLTKVVNLITVLDDIYDIYGSPQELQLLTDTVDKWDVNYALSHLPDYMRLFFFALYNTVNDIAYHVLKEQNLVIIYQLRNSWADLCKAFLREAQWSSNKQSPKLDEYMNNGWVSSSGVVLLTHAYFLITQPITDEAINHFDNDCRDLLCFSSSIFRLANDVTSNEDDTERGVVVKAVSCYMRETGMSDEASRAHVRKLIDQNWKKMNREVTCNSQCDKYCFTQTAANLARISLCQYQYGDAHTNPSDVSIDRIKFVIFEPIS
ncbi:hypothetical protein CASFOL_005520 [Castilleja foliolosa]|uniref:Terpene synthase n=1 Tax=Castilleja foliolosa TaxID=1961234 RepID=A0ABD3E5N0_9LAMI